MIIWGWGLAVIVALLVGFFYWWFFGAPGPEADLVTLAAGFPVDKYKAILRLLESEDLSGMPIELAQALAQGRREVLASYLRELGSDFSRAFWLFVRTQSLHPVPSPRMATYLIVIWARFAILRAKTQWKFYRGLPLAKEASAMVAVVQDMFAHYAQPQIF